MEGIKRLGVAIGLLLSVTTKGDVIRWMVADNATVDGESLYSFLSSQTVDEYNWNAARIRVTEHGETNYLPIYQGDGEWIPGVEGIEIGENAGYWGAGVPDGIQSLLDDKFGIESFFVIEILHNFDDGKVNVLTPTLLAQSDEMSRAALADYIYSQFDMTPSSLATWSPTFFHAIPEPSNGIFLSLGLAMVFLRRKI